MRPGCTGGAAVDDAGAGTPVAAVGSTEVETSAGGRAHRSDFVRNRSRILEAADQLFGSHGLAVTVDEIARTAGIGVGTIYRHFPTKEALFEAIVLRHFDRLVSSIRAVAESESPAETLFGCLSQLVAQAVDKRDLADALAGAGIDIKEASGDLKWQLEAALEHLLVRAQEQGSIRRDVSMTDVMALVAGSCLSAERPGGDGSPLRMLAVVCDGLRSDGGRARSASAEAQGR